MNGKRAFITLLLTTLLSTFVMSNSVFATTTTDTISTSAIADYTLYFDCTDGKLYTDEVMTKVYTSQSDKWSPYQINPDYYALKLNGFQFITSQPNGLVIPEETSIILTNGSTNTITSTYRGTEISSALWGLDRLCICSQGNSTGTLILQGGTNTGDGYSDGIYVEDILTISSGHVFAYGGQDSQSSGIDTAVLNYYSGELVAKGNYCSIYYLDGNPGSGLFCPEYPIFFGGSDAQHSVQLDYSSALNQTLPYLRIYSTLTDVPFDAWYYQNVSAMFDDDIIRGYTNSDGLSYEIRPNNTITRAEFVTILARLFESESDLEQYAGEYTFTDVPDWASKYVGWATEYDYVNGINSSHFGSTENITREQMATILYRIVNKLELTPDSSRFPIEFTDAAQISDYAKNAVTAMQKAGVINGYNNGYDSYRFNPKGQANRAEAFTMIYNFINAYSLNK